MSSAYSDAFTIAVHLKVLWDESVQQHAPKFLSRVIGPETSLHDVVRVLKFLTAKGVYADDLRLGDVIAAQADAMKNGAVRRTRPRAHRMGGPKNAAAGDSPGMQYDDTGKPAGAERRPEDIERLKAQLLCKLVGTREPQTTEDLCQALRLTDADVSVPELALFLESLRSEGRVMRHPQNVRAWTFCPQTQTQFRNVVIKRAEPNRAFPDLSSVPSSPYEAQSAPERVSADMHVFGKPATTHGRAQLTEHLLVAAKTRGLDLRRQGAHKAKQNWPAFPFSTAREVSKRTAFAFRGHSGAASALEAFSARCVSLSADCNAAAMFFVAT